ncbi:MAG: serine acetyltransferase [Clostridia bacterium]|nr:serine acetyltransferase [Clostridia bacterium]
MYHSDERINEIAASLDSIKECAETYFHTKKGMIPSRTDTVAIVTGLQSLMFPCYFDAPEHSGKATAERLEDLLLLIKRQLTAAYSFCGESTIVDTESLAYSILSEIPRIKALLIKDVQAIYEGDPAAKSPEEVILSYPGFIAISVYRIAHELYRLGIPYLPRIMTEYAHEKTGVDIHAGATIGEYFFIDHGTGIVIGETTTIGDHVKIYQGVTLGAKSFELDEQGNPVKGIKRHPDIGNNCVIYANATILGGSTKVGDGAVIGANVWVTHSVEPGSIVYYNNK